MFDGAAAEQLHQFIAAAAAAASLTSPPFDPHHHHHHHPYNNIISPSPNSNSHHHLLLPPHHELNQQVVNIPGNILDHQEKEESRSASSGLASVINDEVDNQVAWGNDELLALLRIRSTMENWFPEFTWEHVSRKLAELGFKRSAEKCKEKFELETSYFNKNNFRFLADLENLYQEDHAPPPPPPVPAETNNDPQKSDVNNKLPEKLPIVSDRDDEVEAPARNTEKAPREERKKKGESVNAKKRKRRQRRFELLKGFCTDVVRRMMEAQEETHGKLLEDMVRRNEDKLAREEAWKVKEAERMNTELETMAKEQASAGDRQSQIIKFLKKLADSENPSPNVDPSENPDEPTSSTTVQNNPTTPPPETLAHHHHHPQSPSSTNPKSPNCSDLGKRWPRDEVLALINLRSGLFSNGSGSSENIGQDKDGGVIKAPLWERISQGMLEKGYNRSAKRCKEKWENINKYFRKTKDVNKKRSLDSRTCPYFHQLSCLYNQGVLIVPASDNQPPEDYCPAAETENRGSGDGGEGNGMVVQEVLPGGGS